MAFDPTSDDPDLVRTVVMLLRTAVVAASTRRGAEQLSTAEEKNAEAVAQLDRIDDIKKAAASIHKSAEKIETSCTTVSSGINRLLSKTKLSEALAAVGIGYVHHRALGNPKDNRAGFRAGAPESRARYREVLDSAAATDALAHVCELLDGGAVAILCFEHNHTECHRNIVVQRLLEARTDAAVVHV